MRMFDLALKVSGKVWLDAPMMRVLKKMYGKKVTPSMTAKEAERILAAVSPDRGRSCIMQHTVEPNPTYDLQIVIPAYNVEKYVRQCLDSVAQQKTKYRVQVVVIDDGATDRTPQIVDEYRDRPGFRIIHQPNKGFSGARNTGLTHIDARYVMFVDSDDLLLPDAVEVMMDNAIRMDSDVLAADYVTMRGNIRKPSGRTMALCEDIDSSKIHGFPWAKVYKAETYAQLGFPEEYWYEDTMQNLVLNHMCRKISTIPNRVYCYRRNRWGITSQSRGKKRTLDSFYVTRRLMQDRQRLGIVGEKRQVASMLLRQFRVNCVRIHTQGNLQLDYAVFLLSAQMMDELVGKDFVLPGSRLHRAFAERNFWEYLRCCMLRKG